LAATRSAPQWQPCVHCCTGHSAGFLNPMTKHKIKSEPYGQVCIIIAHDGYVIQCKYCQLSNIISFHQITVAQFSCNSNCK
jgi:hypothetical protein